MERARAAPPVRVRPSLVRATRVEVQRRRQCRVTLPEGEVSRRALRGSRGGREGQSRAERQGEFAAPFHTSGAAFGHHPHSFANGPFLQLAAVPGAFGQLKSSLD